MTHLSDPQGARREWRAQWLAFPTVRANADGGYDFWAVDADTGVYAEDWPRGERLARETIAHMQRFAEGSSVLRRILRDMPQQSTVAQGFISYLEDALTYPQLHLTANGGEPGPGAVHRRQED
jgi:hypothetical protein